MTNLAFVDTETTGLDPVRHQIWECAVIVRGPVPTGLRPDELGDYPVRWFLPVDVSRADPVALDIGGFHERHPHGRDWNGRGVLTSPALFAKTFAALTQGVHLVGAVTSFDEERLRRLIVGQSPFVKGGLEHGWHYHLVDVENLAAGYLAHKARAMNAAAAGEDWKVGQAEGLLEAARPPWDSEELSRALGVDPDRFDRHTALGDAQWARAFYDTVMGT